MDEEFLTYHADGLAMHSRLFFKSGAGRRPGVLVFPEAFGLDAHAIERARQLAELGYVALACDLHGEGRVYDDLQQAMNLLQPLFDDPARTRARASAALFALAEHPQVEATRIAALGFCFPSSLELARSGADIRAAVGFHTSLATKAARVEHGVVKARVLVCIGSEDPFIPREDREEFAQEMRDVGADWEMEIYGRTYHGFTNPEADRRNMPHAIRYNGDSTKRAWASALDMLTQTIGVSP